MFIRRFSPSLLLVGLVVATAPDRRITPPYLAVLAVTLAGLGLAAQGLVAGLRRLPRPETFELRTAVAAMLRPGGATATILVSIVLGATLIVAVALDSSIQKVIRSSWARLGKKAIKSEEDGGGGVHAAEK